ALSIMRFPADMVEAVGEHHGPLARVASPWGRLLIAADTVALTISGCDHETNATLASVADTFGWPGAVADALVDEVRVPRADLPKFVAKKPFRSGPVGRGSRRPKRAPGALAAGPPWIRAPRSRCARAPHPTSCRGCRRAASSGPRRRARPA